MEIITVEPTMVTAHALPLEEVRILPIGDIQYGASGCDVDRLERHIQWGVENDCYYIGMGDYLDVASPSNRAKIKAAGFYDSVVEAMDAKMAAETEKVREILAPTQGRWLGLVRGHHYWEFSDGTTTDTRLADYLGCDFLGDVGVILVKMGKSTATLWVTHGKGSGTTPGAPLNFLAQIAQRFAADVYLAGHRHTKVTAPIPLFSFDLDGKGKPRFHSQNRYLVSTGGFLKGYEEGSTDLNGLPAGNYIEQGLLSPVTLGGPLVKIRPRLRNGRHGVDINVEV